MPTEGEAPKYHHDEKLDKLIEGLSFVHNRLVQLDLQGKAPDSYPVLAHEQFEREIIAKIAIEKGILPEDNQLLRIAS